MMTVRDHLCDDHAPLTVKVARQLREQIVNGELAGGTRLVEHALSEAFGVSRVPVREALRLLAVQGLADGATAWCHRMPDGGSADSGND